MADTGADAAQRYREHMKAKAERLGGGEDATRVDASEFTPGEKLYAGVKTGMRPVSRQARADGGAVSGGHAAATPGRAGRKAGGGVGESYVNRDQKAANAEREGEYPNGGMKKGGRAHRAEGGEAPRGPRHCPDCGLHRDNGHLPGCPSDPDPFWRDQGKTLPWEPKSAQVLPYRPKPANDRATGGRAERRFGGYLPREERAGGNATRFLKTKTASSDVEGGGGRPAAEDGRLGRASGGRVARQAGGPLSTPLSAGMGGQGRLSFNYGPQTSMASKLGIKRGGVVRADGGRAKAHERYGHGPSCSCPECRVGKANGGAAFGSDENDATPGSVATPLAAKAKTEDVGAVGQPSLKHRAPKGENSSRARTLASAKGRAYGGSAAERDENRAAEHAEDPAAYRAKYKGPFSSRPSILSADQRKAAIDKASAQIGKAFGKKAGGEVERKVLSAHKAEHEAMAKGRARGGKAGKGKMNVNIVIGTPGGMSQPSGPMGPNPQLALKPPQPAAPMPMPMPPGGAPAPGAPTPMPIPIPVGAAGAGAMPPRARGGRAPKVRGETQAGAGSGLGRLQKAEEYGHRSREGEGLRK